MIFLPVMVGAQWLAGLDLSLTSLGLSNYQARFIYYRDCGGINAPNTVSMQFQCPTNPALNFNLTSVPRISIQDLTPVCPGILSRCAGGSNDGYQAHVYETLVTLPPCSNWKVSHSNCCRPPSVTIQGVAGMSGYIETRLNNLDAPFNSSPVFTNNPVNFMCTGQQSIINHGATDPDGDSLSYSLANPFESSSTYLIWLPPYSSAQPIASNPPVTIDPVTGEIRMKPTMNIQSLMLLKADQWRTLNGVPTLVGTSYRDVKLTSLNCNNQLPLLGGISMTPGSGYNPADTIFRKDVCLGDTVVFSLYGHDADTPNSTIPGNREKFNLSWNQGIPQAAFQVYHQDSDSAWAQFYWTPTAADRGLHCFTATIRDFACPYNGVQTYTYCLKVVGMVATLTPDTSVCQGEPATFHVVTDPPASDYLWYIDGVPVLTPTPTPTLYVNTSGMVPGIHTIRVEAIDGNPAQVCTGKSVSNLTINSLPSVFLGNDTLLTAGESILLDAGPGFSSYLWSTGHTGQFCLLDTAGTGTGTQTVWVHVTDVNGCSTTDTIQIHFVTGINTPLAGTKLQIVPNPSQGTLWLYLDSMPPGDGRVDIYSSDGRLVFQRKIVLKGDHDWTLLNLDFLEDGFYYLTVSGAGGATSGKLILKRTGSR